MILGKSINRTGQSAFIGDNLILKLQFAQFTKIEISKYFIKIMNGYLEDEKKKREKKKNKAFKDYFDPKYSIDDLNKLKKIFNKNNSPKEYAIMICLLTQKKLVSIKDGGRAEFFRAWYDFIEETKPGNSNFFAINKYIDDESKKGLEFSKPNDPKYFKFQDLLEKQFKTIV